MAPERDQATVRPSGGELERGLHRREPDVRPAPPADEHLVPLAGLLEVVAEVVAELVGADLERLGRAVREWS